MANGGADASRASPSRLIGMFEFDSSATATTTASSSRPAFVQERRTHSPSACRALDPRQTAFAQGDGHSVNRRPSPSPPCGGDDGVAGDLSRRRRSSSPSTCCFHARDVVLLASHRGVGYLYGGIVGAVASRSGRTTGEPDAQYWQFWIGAILVVLVLAGREHLTERAGTLWTRVANAFSRRRGPLPAATPVREV